MNIIDKWLKKYGSKKIENKVRKQLEKSEQKIMKSDCCNVLMFIDRQIGTHYKCSKCRKICNINK